MKLIRRIIPLKKDPRTTPRDKEKQTVESRLNEVERRITVLTAEKRVIRREF